MNMLNACNETEDTDKRTKCKQIYDHKIILNGKSYKISKKLWRSLMIFFYISSSVRHFKTLMLMFDGNQRST